MALITSLAIEEVSGFEIEGGGLLRDDYFGRQVIEAARELLKQQTSEHADPLPLCHFFERHDDMNQGRLRLILDGDSDVSIAVITHEGEMADVEFCTPFSGGGRSPKVREALLNLCRAIQIGNVTNPIRDFRSEGKAASTLAASYGVVSKASDDSEWSFVPGALFFDQDTACQHAHVLAGAGDNDTKFSAVKIDRAGVVPVGETYLGTREL